jgi:hypothetical protein
MYRRYIYIQNAETERRDVAKRRYCQRTRIGCTQRHSPLVDGKESNGFICGALRDVFRNVRKVTVAHIRPYCNDVLHTGEDGRTGNKERIQGSEVNLSSICIV